MRRVAPLFALASLFCLGAISEEEIPPGLDVGTKAPELKGTEWITKDGKSPELNGKVRLIDFWFEA